MMRLSTNRTHILCGQWVEPHGIVFLWNMQSIHTQRTWGLKWRRYIAKISRYSHWYIAKVWLFYCDFTHASCTFIGLNDAVGYQNWQIKVCEGTLSIREVVKKVFLEHSPKWGGGGPGILIFCKILADMEFVKKFTHPYFQAKSFTPQKCVICDSFFAN